MTCVEYCPNCLHNVVCAIPIIDDLLDELYESPENACSYFTPEKTCKPVYGVCRDPFCPNCLSTLARYEKGLFGRAIKVDDTMNYCGHCGAKVIR